MGVFYSDINVCGLIQSPLTFPANIVDITCGLLAENLFVYNGLKSTGDSVFLYDRVR